MRVVYSPAAMRAGSFLALAALVGLGACYDSRWGEAKRAQQHVAADTKPADIGPGSGDRPPATGSHTLHVRMRPNGRYLALTVDAPKQLADLVDDANQVLGPALGLELDVDRIQPWSADLDGPDDALTALMNEDPGTDVDVVVGLIGALPRHTDSLHELGVATLLGKHMVLRGAGRADEQDAIEHGFTELSEDDRARMVRQRKRHRALAVFLHELGHSLGAVHEEAPLSLMHPVYDPKMNAFGGGGIALMRVALDGGGSVAVARGQLDLLRGRVAGEWVAVDRDKEVVHLEALLAGAPRPADAAAAAPGNVSGLPVPPELRGADGERLRKASSLFQGGAVAAAYGEAKPLFASYPDVRAVQDLRCQLATLRYLGADALSAECAASVRLAGTLDGGAGGR
jgi:hypothetical protein